RDQRLDLLQQDFVLYQLLKLRDGIANTRDPVLIFPLADELAAGKQRLPQLTLLQVLAEIVVGGVQPHAPRFHQQYLFVDQVLRRLAGKVGSEHLGLRTAARKLLLHHLPRLLLGLLGGDVFAGDRGHHTGLGGRSAQEVRASDSGDEGDRHHGGNKDQKASQDDLLD